MFQMNGLLPGTGFQLSTQTAGNEQKWFVRQGSKEDLSGSLMKMCPSSPLEPFQSMEVTVWGAG